MIEYTLHKLPQGFIITSRDDFHNNNLVPNDFAYHRGTKEVLQVISKNNETGSWLCNDGTNRDCYKLFKVIAQQPQIIFSSLKEEEQKEIDWVDWLRIAVLSEDDEMEKIGREYQSHSWYKGVEFGFQKAQELLSDRKFTLEDMITYTKWLQETASRNGAGRWVSFDNAFYDKSNKEMVEKWLSTFQPKSWKVELEMNTWFENGYDGKIIPTSPKLTDGKIKILKLL